MKDKTKELADSVGAVYPVLFMGRHDGVLFTETELETFVELVAAAEREACAPMTDLRQAAQQALEALENSSPDQYPEDAGVHYDAKDALRTALEQPPQQQAEPVALAHSRHAKLMAKFTENAEAMKALAQAEPAAYFDFQEQKFSWAKHMKIGPVPVSIKVEPMKLYLEAPQQQAEPVAYLCENAVGHKYFRWKKPSSTYKPIALYTAPPQRQWVGLTDDEMTDTVVDMDVDFGDLLWKVVCLTKIIEAKLKERNI